MLIRGCPGSGLGTGFGAFLFNYVFKRRFRNERFLVVSEQFWDRVLRTCIELRVQKVFGNVVHYGGPAPVLGSCFEHVYSVKRQLRVQKVFGNGGWSKAK